MDVVVGDGGPDPLLRHRRHLVLHPLVCEADVAVDQPVVGGRQRRAVAAAERHAARLARGDRHCHSTLSFYTFGTAIKQPYSLLMMRNALQS